MKVRLVTSPAISLSFDASLVKISLKKRSLPVLTKIINKMLFDIYKKITKNLCNIKN